MAKVELKFETKNGEYTVDRFNGLKSVSSLSQSTADAKSINYGVLPSSGSAEIVDANGTIKQMIESGTIDNSNVPVSIYVNGNKIQEHITTESEYSSNDKIFTVSLNNKLSILDNLMFDGKVIGSNYSLFDLLNEVFYRLDYIKENLRSWNRFLYRKYSSVAAGSPEIDENNNISVTTTSGIWSLIYLKLNVEANKQHNIKFKYTTNTYSGKDGTHTGVAFQILNSVPKNSDCSDISIQTTQLSNIAVTNSEVSVDFTPTVSTIYLCFNFGYAQDGETINLSINDFSINEKSISTIVDETIIYGEENTEGTVKSYLQGINAKYAYLDRSTFRETLDKICQVAQLNLIEDNNGKFKLINGRPRSISSPQIIKIPPKNQFSKLTYDVVIKNKLKGAQIQEHFIDTNPKDGYVAVKESTTNGDIIVAIGSTSPNHVNYGVYYKNYSPYTPESSYLRSYRTSIDEYEKNYQIIYTYDGLNFSTTSTELKQAKTVAYGNGVFVAGGEKMLYSEDGVLWFNSNATFTSSAGPCIKVVFGNGKFIATIGNRYIYYSTDGINWNSVDTGISYVIDIIFGDGKFILITDQSITPYYSSDGINWNAGTMPSEAYTWYNNLSSDYMGWNSKIAYGENEFGKMFVIVCISKIFYSSDGVNWNMLTYEEVLSDIEFYNGWFYLSFNWYLSNSCGSQVMGIKIKNGATGYGDFEDTKYNSDNESVIFVKTFTSSESSNNIFSKIVHINNLGDKILICDGLYYENKTENNRTGDEISSGLMFAYSYGEEFFEFIPSSTTFDVSAGISPYNSIPSSSLVSDITSYNSNRVSKSILNNTISDYSNGIKTGSITVSCADYYLINSSTKVKDWENGEIIDVGDIVRIDDKNGNSYVMDGSGGEIYFRVTGREFTYNGVPMLNLELQEVLPHGANPYVTLKGYDANGVYEDAEGFDGTIVGYAVTGINFVNKKCIIPTDQLVDTLDFEFNTPYGSGDEYNIYISSNIKKIKKFKGKKSSFGGIQSAIYITFNHTQSDQISITTGAFSKSTDKFYTDWACSIYTDNTTIAFNDYESYGCIATLYKLDETAWDKVATPIISESISSQSDSSVTSTFTITCDTTGASIYYRIGTSGSYQLYTQPFSYTYNPSTSDFMYAYAIKDNYVRSSTRSYLLRKVSD